MDISEMSAYEDPAFVNIDIVCSSGKDSYNTFIRQQQTQRERDRRKRLRTGCIDQRKRINEPMILGNNSSVVSQLHESIMHHNPHASTSNKEIHNISNFELEGTVNGLNVPSTSYVLPTSTYCKHCNARKFYRESKCFCCSDGKIKLFLSDSPNELYNLFTSKELSCMEFKKIARGYNNHFAFTSFGVKYDKDLFKAYKGIYTFRVQGQVHHYINQLVPQNNTPSYMQLYFYDTDNEVQNRMKLSSNFAEATLMVLIEILKTNPYSRFFRSLSDMTNLHDHRIQIRCDPGLDQRVFNTPTASQVAAIWVEDDENANVRVRNITIYGHSGDSHRVHYYYGCYDPLQYPLLFPFGESGWHEGIQRYRSTHSQPQYMSTSDVLLNGSTSAAEFIEKENQVLNGANKRTQVSCREYYSYKLQIRSSGKSVLLHAGRLLQQYVVDMYVKIETARLDYFRNNQKQIRAELYQGIVDSVQNGETRGCKIGRKFVLPQSFTCGPRDMLRRYMDGMAIVQRYGKPDIFLTITCNPNWPEIKQELCNNDEVQNRPDLIVRIFRAKLEELKHDLYKASILGPVVAHIYVIEFQKRGLPHAHLLLIFNSGHKISCAEEVDRIVCCEIPDRNKHPHLHSVIVKHNMHGPCGNLNPKNVCMEANKGCKNKYPKDYCDRTIFGQNSYPLYKRRHGISVQVRGQMLDNRWVVPYNPYLSAKFDCHINVEVCSSIKAVKYLYKYVYKGHDRINFSIHTDESEKEIDEISAYQSARWISPPEAMWRIFSFNLAEIYPTVYSLQLHVENHQRVTYTDEDDLSTIVENENTKRTMLTEFFRMNEADEFARTLLYRDFPTHFVWNTNKKIWTRRKKHVVIGRIVTVSPSEGERYFLRVLMNHIRGSTSFHDLRTANGVTVLTYREAALLHGLLSGDNHCEECLSESIIYGMPISLRRLFATLLVLCNPYNPKLLWDKFKCYMIDDYVHENIPSKVAEVRALEDISCILESLGKNINDYQIVAYSVNMNENDRLRRMVEDETTNLDIEGGNACAARLNNNQQFAYDTIMEKITSGLSGTFFIDGPGGTGKTFLYKALLAAVRSQNSIALATASSGVSASLLPGGRTAHSRFKIPLETVGDVSCSVSKQSALGTLLKMSKLIIWDEAPMVNRCAIEAVDKMLRDITDCNLPFGGKVVVLGGDFRQVLPVVPRGKKEDIMKASLVFSELWHSFLHLPLIENMRAKFDPTFCDYLLRIGNGTEEQHTCKCIKLPNSIVVPFKDEITSLRCLIHHVFPNIEAHVDNLHMMANRAILTPRNECVDHINKILLEQIPGEIFTYYSFDEAIDKSEQSLQEDLLNSLTSNGIPPHELNLKLNCPVMLLRNINPSEGLCNGTRLTCRKFQKNVILAEIMSGEYLGKHVFLPRIPFIPLESDKSSIPFKRTQFPIRPCFAMTINKAQGQTLDFVGLYLPEPVFCHGQLYVALSRAKTSKSVKVLLNPSSNESLHNTCTKNVVYKEILSIIHL